MSKKLIVVSRVTVSDEFSQVFSLKDDPFKNFDGRIIVVNGRELQHEDEGKPFSNTINNIIGQVEKIIKADQSTANEYFILYHPGAGGFNCDAELRSIDGVIDAKEYSSVGNTMKWIQDEIKGVVSSEGTEEDLDNLLDRCFGNQKTESYLELLHKCLNYQPVDNSDTFLEAKKYLSVGDSEIWLGFKDNPNIETLRALRDQLLGA